MKYFQFKTELWNKNDPKSKTYPNAFIELGMVGSEYLHSNDNLDFEEKKIGYIPNNQLEIYLSSTILF